MTRSMMVIDLPGPVAGRQVARLSGVLRELAGRFEEARVGSYDVTVEPGQFGIAGTGDCDGHPRMVTISISGPGFGDEAVFRAEHAGDPDLEPLIGFTPTHDVVLVTAGTEQIDRFLLTELAAVVQEVVGGLADVRIPARLLDEVRDLPGVVAVSEQDDQETPRVFGGAEFLRAWAAAPGFWQFALVGAPPRAV